MGNEKQVRTIRERYGKDFFEIQGRKAHKRGPGFLNPDSQVKAIATRKRNRELAKEAKDEIQADNNI